MSVDVVLITYNQEKYIAQAVESILMQRVNEDLHVRVIVADDCSKDKTLEIIKSYEDKSPFPFFYLPSEQNMGIAANYKRAFEATEADYVAVMEGDDWWIDSHRIQKHIECFQNHKDCVLTKNNYLQYSQFSKIYSVEQSSYEQLTLSQSLRDYVLANMSATMFRGDLVRKMDDRVYEFGHALCKEATDVYTHLYLLQFGCGYVLNDVMSAYRVDTGENISLVDRTDQEIVDRAKLRHEQSVALVGEKYEKDSYVQVLETQELVAKNKRNRRYQNLSNYIPPFLAELSQLERSRFVYGLKHKLRRCIPNKIYDIIHRKKCN